MACGEGRTDRDPGGAPQAAPSRATSVSPPLQPTGHPDLPDCAAPAPPPRGEGRDPRRDRALLLLSLTVLVWYAVATARRFPSSAPEPLPGMGGAAADAGRAGNSEGASSSREGRSGPPLSVRQKYLLGRRVDINRADFKEISELPGITDETAREVVALRARRGGFTCPQDLLAVRGIKEKRLKKLLPFLAGFTNN